MIDWRDPVVLHRQAMRRLDNMPWAPRPTLRWRAMAAGAATTVLLVAAVALLWVVLP